MRRANISCKSPHRFQLAVVLSVIGWWLLSRDSASTVAAVAITLILSSWMMSRDRIRRSLAGDQASSRPGGRVDDDRSAFERPFLCLDEINDKRKAQERKDRMACRIGIVCTVLAGIVAVAGVSELGARPARTAALHFPNRGLSSPSP